MLQSPTEARQAAIQTHMNAVYYALGQRMALSLTTAECETVIALVQGGPVTAATIVACLKLSRDPEALRMATEGKRLFEQLMGLS